MSYNIVPVNADISEILAGISTPTYGTEFTLPDGRVFIYCYTALTTIVKGGCVAIRTGGATTAGRNPLATLPETDDNIAAIYGIAAETKAAAGGLWIQTKGRCTYACVDGATDVSIGDWLKPVDGVQYLTQDAAVGSVRSVAGIAVAEEAETVAIASQTDTTHGDATHQVYLPGVLGTL